VQGGAQPAAAGAPTKKNGIAEVFLPIPYLI
jgi:hypothetical protein